MDEATLRLWVQRVSGALNYVNNGFTVAIGTGLSVDVAAGECVNAGVWIKRDVSTNVAALTANATNYIYVGFDDTAQDVVLFTKNTTGATPAGYQLIAVAVTNATNVTSVEDRRNLVAISGWRD